MRYGHNQIRADASRRAGTPLALRKDVNNEVFANDSGIEIEIYAAE